MSGSGATQLPAEFFQQPGVTGMVHLAALPGANSCSQSLAATIRQACRDARALESGGAVAVIVENFFDGPFARRRVPRHTLAGMTLAAAAVRRAVQLPMGLNVLRNDARSAIAIAHLCGGAFVRINVFVGAAVTDQGILQGAARSAVAYRSRLGANVQLWADVDVKHGATLGTYPVERAAADAAGRGGAAAIIVSGSTTGQPADAGEVRRVAQALPGTPVLVGSGASVERVGEYLPHAAGFIVGTSLKRNGDVSAPIDADRVRALVRALRHGPDVHATS
ncbi:MAG: BtpA/SgcQ family protein [Armatimonadetes bacterium]|nr:BtpA/SgcQ family protein [Armatimonadota bacterium]MDE2205124.1 BtpA/SgcQ family protein [Armatimonadota bacterium]